MAAFEHNPCPPRPRGALRFEPLAPTLKPGKAQLAGPRRQVDEVPERRPSLVGSDEWQPGDSIVGTQYRFVRELGRGVQGVAMEVEHAFLGARAVMKILRAQHVSRKSVAERVRAEARALVDLRHRNIARVTDGGMTAEAEPRPFFVMELLAGDTLRARLKEGGALPIRQALDVAIDILDALDHAHGRNMVHRDVKPANIFLARTSPARAILLDFGIASVIEPGHDRRASFCGTLEYAAPEQLDGALSPLVDVYALAFVLYGSLLGRHPFAGAPREDLPRLQREVTPAPIHSLLPDVPPALAQLIASAMHKDPAHRPRSAFAFAQKLRDIRAGLREAQLLYAGSQVGSPDSLLRELHGAPGEGAATPTRREGAAAQRKTRREAQGRTTRRASTTSSVTREATTQVESSRAPTCVYSASKSTNAHEAETRGVITDAPTRVYVAPTPPAVETTSVLVAPAVCPAPPSLYPAYRAPSVSTEISTKTDRVGSGVSELRFERPRRSHSERLPLSSPPVLEIARRRPAQTAPRLRRRSRTPAELLVTVITAAFVVIGTIALLAAVWLVH